MINLALVGKNISHSKSADVYRKLLPNEEIHYSLIDITNDSELPLLEDLFACNSGISITSPYKTSYLDKVVLDEVGSNVQSVNCIKKTGDIFYATNTDYYAVKDILQSFVAQHGEIKVCLLGDGVMSKLTVLVLKMMNISYEIFSRKNANNLSQINLESISMSTKKKLIIINSCAREFVFKGSIPRTAIFWDYNYNFLPHQSSLVKMCTYVDGLAMLELQALHALKFWGLK